MSKRTIFGLTVIVLLAGGLLWYGFSQQNSSADQPIASVNQSEIPESEAALTNNLRSSPELLPKGVYEPYSQQAIASATGTKVLFFHAPWCRQCQMIEADIKSMGVPDGVSIFKVDYDTNNELRKMYGVTLQTTFVKVNASGDLVQKFVAYEDPTFKSVIANIL